MLQIENNNKEMMTFESLSNDTLLDLFEYFHGIDLFQTFNGLNHRFTYLLYHQFQRYYFDLSTESKRKFDRICQQYLPFVANRVTNLCLGEIGRIPQQINYFFSYISSLSQFTRLRSLSIKYIYSTDTLFKIIDECQHLIHLTHLNIHFFCLFIDPTGFEIHLDTIWSLPKLTHLTVFIPVEETKVFLPTITSSTLKFVDIQSMTLSSYDIDQLFQTTPNLKHLSIRIESIDHDPLIPTSLPTLTKLNITFSSFCNISQILLFLQKLSNLRHLNITLMSNLINGNQWEHLICHHLFKLKTFHLNMIYEFHGNINIQDQANQLIDTFRSSFWIEEHRWFVRYHLIEDKLHLFTLSNAFQYYNNKLPYLWKSTDPNDNQRIFYGRATVIYYKKFFKQLFILGLHLSNVDYLCIEFPLDNQFWSIVTSFKRLYSLTIFSYDDKYQSQLQTIIDQASELSHLEIYQDESLPLQMSLFRLTNLFIRKLILGRYYLTEEECMTLSRSDLGKNCEYLSIYVENYQSTLILVHNMINLQMLYVEYGHEIESQMSNDEVVEWLKDHLPSTCLISKDPQNIDILQIWI